MIECVKKHYPHIVLNLIAITVVLIWIPKNTIIGGGDFGPILADIRSVLSITLTSWTDILNLGWANGLNVSFAFLLLFFKSVSFFTTDVTNFYRILYYLWIIAALYGVFFLSNTLKINPIGSIFASFFYVFNIYSVSTTWYGGGFVSTSFYVGIPWLINCFFIISCKKIVSFKNKILILFSLSLVIFLASFNNYGTIFSIFIIIVLIFIYYFLVSNIDRNILIKRFVLLCLIFLFLNLFWITPSTTTLETTYEVATKSGETKSIFENVVRNNPAKLLHVIELKSVPGLWWSYKTDWYYPWFRYYLKPELIIIEFILLLLILSPFFSTYKKKHNDSYLILFILLILLWFLSKGSGAPIKDFYITFFSTLGTISDAFRNPISKWAVYIPLIYSILLGVSVHNILKNKKALLYVIFILVILLVYTYPILNGSFFDTYDNKFLPSYRFEIPIEYTQAKAYFEKFDTLYRVFPVPQGKGYFSAYNWYVGAMPDAYLLGVPSISMIGSSREVPNYLNIEFEKINNYNVINKLASLSNIRFIVLHKDTNIVYTEDHTGWYQQDAKSIEKFMRSNYSEQFNSTLFSIYAIPDTAILPHIYTTFTQVTIPTFDSFIPTVDSDTFQPDQQSIIILAQNQNKTILHTNFTVHPHIFFQKINPTKYKVKIESAHEPFYLTLSESYHAGWQAYINTDTMQCNSIATYENVNVTECQPESRFFEIKDLTRIFGKHVAEDKHFVVNGYANGWYIDPHELGTGENFTVTLYFKPQSYFYIGLIISGLTFMGCIGYLLWDWRKKRKSKLSI